MPETRLQQAQRHVNRGRQLVERQREFIEQLRSASADISDAEDILACFARSLVIFEKDLATTKHDGVR